MTQNRTNRKLGLRYQECIGSLSLHSTHLDRTAACTHSLVDYRTVVEIGQLRISFEKLESQHGVYL